MKAFLRSKMTLFTVTLVRMGCVLLRVSNVSTDCIMAVENREKAVSAGIAASAPSCCIKVAKPSLSQSWSHHVMVTRLPNH